MTTAFSLRAPSSCDGFHSGWLRMQPPLTRLDLSLSQNQRVGGPRGRGDGGTEITAKNQNVRVDLDTVEKKLHILSVREDTNNPFARATRSPKVTATWLEGSPSETSVANKTVLDSFIPRSFRAGVRPPTASESISTWPSEGLDPTISYLSAGSYILLL